MIQAPALPVHSAEQPGSAEEITMTAIKTDDMRDRIAAYAFPRGGVEVVRANRGYTLYSRRTDRPVAPAANWPGQGSGAVVARTGLGRSGRLRLGDHVARSRP